MALVLAFGVVLLISVSLSGVAAKHFEPPDNLPTGQSGRKEDDRSSG